MNPSFYGLVLSIQRRVEPVHFMDNFNSTRCQIRQFYGLYHVIIFLDGPVPLLSIQCVVEFVHVMDSIILTLM